MANWEDKANEVQSLLDKGYTNAELAKHFNVAIKTIKNRLPELEREGLIKRPKDRVKVQQEAKGKHTLERNKDGTYTSARDKLWLRNDMIYNDEYILEQHGFNPKDWEIITVRHNQWENYSKKDGITELFASKVTVKPRTQGWTFDDLLKAIREDIQPVHIETEPAHISDQRMLEIPFYDMHFGVSDYDHYKHTQRDTYDILNSKRWEETLFIVGQDLLHNNDFSGKTANGTQIEVVDIPKAWKEARLFYITLIETAIRQSNHVKIIYSRGNHDEAMSWAFVQMLMERYPQIEFEDSLEDRKVHTFGRIFGSS